MAEIISFWDERFKKLYKKPVLVLNRHARLVLKAYEIAVRVKEKENAKNIKK